MTSIPFDTLKFATKLEAGGFTREQAKAAEEAFSEATGAELVTKSDLREMELRLDARLKDMQIKTGAMLFALAGVVIAALKIMLPS